MDFGFFMPTRIITGTHIVREHADDMALGKHALIVTGKRSARLSGALDDVVEALSKNGIDYTVFDEITENPLAETCHRGGAVAREAGADFVIGIGGGSPLDAAKAIAAYAVLPKIAPTDIYTAALPVSGMLPIVAIPTTAGTGSEANPYAVLTLPGGDVKKTFKPIPGGYPKITFVDPRYTYSLSEEYTVSTALDAFSHALESYLSPKANISSEMHALFAAKQIWDVIFHGADDDGKKDAGGFTPVQRERLSLAALAAGIAINRTSTGFPHPLGYSITLSEGVPHGRACGAFAGAYIVYNMRTVLGEKKLIRFAAYLGTSPGELARRIPAKANVNLTLTREQIDEHVNRVASASNYANSPYVLSHDEMIMVYSTLFGK